MISDRQEKILELLIKEYIDSARPVSSDMLKKRLHLDISPATIRNELQELMEAGYVAQPHTSAGRVPTEKGYRFFVTVTITPQNHQLPSFIHREIQEARENIKKELLMAENLVESLHRKLALLDEVQDFAKEETLYEILTILGSLYQ